jgi:hypothetical protein
MVVILVNIVELAHWYFRSIPFPVGNKGEQSIEYNGRQVLSDILVLGEF